jgi:hypothetical protein
MSSADLFEDTLPRTEEALYTVTPLIDTNLTYKDLFLKTSDGISLTPFTATNFSNSGVSWSIPTPNKTSFTDRAPVIAMPVYGYWAINPAFVLGTHTLPELSTVMSLRAYPLASVTKNSNVQVEQQGFSLNTMGAIPQLSHYWDQEKTSSFPDMTDRYQTYISGHGATNDPMANFSASIGNIVPRGAFPIQYKYAIVGGVKYLFFETIIFEPCWSNAFLKDYGGSLGFSNVSTMVVTLSFNNSVGGLARIFSISELWSEQRPVLNQPAFLDPTSPSNFVVNIGSPPPIWSTFNINNNQKMFDMSTINGPTIVFRFSNAPIEYTPQALVYRTEQIDVQSIVSDSPMTFGEQRTVKFNSYTLGCVPDGVMISAKEDDSYLNVVSTDSYLNISGNNITFDGTPGILSTANEEDLFNICRDNGLKDDWSTYHGLVSTSTIDPNTGFASLCGTSASPVFLKFGKDITLRTGIYPGQVGSFSFSANITINNTKNAFTGWASNVGTLNSPPDANGTVHKPNIYVTFFSRMKLVLDPHSSKLLLGVPTLPMNATYQSYDDDIKNYGGAFKDSVKKITSKLGRFYTNRIKPWHTWAKDNKIASTALAAFPSAQAQILAKALESYGYGVQKKRRAPRRKALTNFDMTERLQN